MPSENKILIASAGSGKTTTIVERAGAETDQAALLVTYTVNGRDELLNKAYEVYGHVPPHLTIMTWFSFLLVHMVRPYQNQLETSGQRVNGIHFNNGISAKYSKASDIVAHYFSNPGRIYRDKVAKFACEVNRHTSGKPIIRLETIFSSVYFDESQDFAGYDLDIIELLLRSKIQTTLVGDPRQATYITNNGPKYKKFRGAAIVDMFLVWEKRSLCEIEYHNHSHRCVQSICDFADRFHSIDEPTVSKNEVVTGHDGVFAIRRGDVGNYIERFECVPQVLRYSRGTKNLPGRPINFGESKGMTFERVLIFPHGPLAKYMRSGDIKDVKNSIEKVYVAITRARQSVGIVVDDGYAGNVVPVFELI